MLQFAGHDLESYMKVIEISKPIGPSRKNYTKDIGSRHGLLYDGYKYEAKTITVKADIRCDSDMEYKMKIRELAEMTHTEQEEQLFIDHGFFYYAVRDGEIKEEKICRGMGRITINFLCCNPFAYYSVVKTHNLKQNEEIVVTNDGNVGSEPYFAIGINKQCSFVRIDNTTSGKTILLGAPKTVEVISSGESVPAKDQYLVDDCTSTSGWIVENANVDGGRTYGGTLATTTDGSGICCGSFGDSSESAAWHGVAARKTLDNSLSEFEVNVKMQHSSTGENGDPTKINNGLKETPTSGERKTYYKITANSVNVRSGPGTSYKILGSVTKGYKIEKFTLNKGWIKFTYNGKTAYITEKYCQKVTSDSTTTSKEQNFVTTEALAIRATPAKTATNKKTIPKHKAVRCIKKDYTDSKKNVYYKLAVPYEGVTGYVLKKYLVPAENVTIDTNAHNDTADDKTGVIELYGLSREGTKLFKLALIDDDKWYEFTYPLIQVGNEDFLKDKTVANDPLQTNKGSGNQDSFTIEQNNYMSGQFGSWNDFYGNLRISRDKEGKWSAMVQKMVAGSYVKTIKEEKKSSDYPTGDLAQLVLYIGTAGDAEKASGMALCDITISKVNATPGGISREVKYNIDYFNKGDGIIVDCFNTAVVTAEGDGNAYLDVGSSFFDIVPGENKLKLTSDGEETTCVVQFNEKYLEG